MEVFVGFGFVFLSFHNGAQKSSSEVLLNKWFISLLMTNILIEKLYTLVRKYSHFCLTVKL